MTGQIVLMGRPSVREQLLATAVQTLRVRGFNGCSVEEITQAAGVPKGSFYNHFDSKENLSDAVLERYWQNAAEFRAVLSDKTMPPLQRFKRYFSALCTSFTQEHLVGGCLIGNFSLELSDQSPIIRRRLSQVFKDWTSTVEACVKEAQERGDVRAEIDAAVLAQFVVNAFEGALLRAKVDKTSAALDSFMNVVLAKILC